MAKKTKITKPAEIAQPVPMDFERARNQLRQRAYVLIVELAKRYHAGKAEELTAILNAMDCATELERMGRMPDPQS